MASTEFRDNIWSYCDVARDVYDASQAIGMTAPTDPDSEHPGKGSLANLDDNQLRAESDRSSRRMHDLEWASNFYAILADNLRKLQGADYKGMISECMRLSNDLKKCSEEHKQRLDSTTKEEESRAERKRRRSSADVFEEMEALKAKVAELEATR